MLDRGIVSVKQAGWFSQSLSIVVVTGLSEPMLAGL